MMRLSERLIVFAVRWLVPKRAYPVLAGPLRGRRFVLGAAAGPAGGLSIFFGRSEPRQAAAIASALRPGSTFFDVGANVGFYTLLAADRVGAAGRVVAFEPMVRNLACLQRHLELNRVANATVLPFAVSSEQGYGLFEAGDTVATGHLASPVGGVSAGAAPVHLTTVDAMASLLRLRPDVMKIDVEGAEAEVLRGAVETLRAHRPVIFLSIHSDALRERCLAFLRDLGYEASPIEGSPETATEYRLVHRAGARGEAAVP